MILLDAEKAFDRVTWKYLWGILEQRGFGPKIMGAIRAMYLDPKARIQIMGGSSEKVYISRGTRQGCPCSPILFALYIDPLVRKLLGCNEIKPVVFNRYETKLLAYADDLAIITPEPDTALIVITRIASEFGHCSGYMLNESKTQIICTKNIRRQDARYSDSAVYLGVKIGSATDTIIKDNFTPLLKTMVIDLKRIDALHLSIIGRANVLKMTMLPKVLYFFRSIPFMIDEGLLKSIESVFMNFIWQYGKIRRSMRYLSLPQEKGGLAIPNIKYYLWACLLGQMAILFDSASNLSDIPPDNNNPPSIYELLLGREALGLLLRKTDRRYYKKMRYKVLDAVWEVWKQVKKVLIIPKINYYTPVWNCSMFPHFSNDKIWRLWEQQGIKRIGDIYDGGSLMRFEDIQMRFGIPDNLGFKFLQIQDTLRGIRPRIIPGGRIDILDYLLGGGIKIKKIYGSLLSGTQDDLEKFETAWAMKLGDPDVDIDRALQLAGKLFRSTNLRAQHYKTLFNLYFTPAKLFMWGKKEDDRCPRCGEGPADLLHMFYHCSKLSVIQGEIGKFWEGLLGVKITLSPILMIMGFDSNLGLNKEKEAFVFISVAVLRILLAAGWKDTVAPSFQMWLARLLGIHNIESSLYIHRGRKMRELGMTIWAPMKWWRDGCLEEAPE